MNKLRNEESFFFAFLSPLFLRQLIKINHKRILLGINTMGSEFAFLYFFLCFYDAYQRRFTIVSGRFTLLKNGKICRTFWPPTTVSPFSSFSTQKLALHRYDLYVSHYRKIKNNTTDDE